MSDIYILGAGFSKAISEAMPVLVDLSDEILKRLPEIEPINALFPRNLEMWMSYLSQNHPWLSEAQNARNRALFLEMSEAIYSVLLERMQIPISHPRPEWLSNLVKCWNQEKTPVLTLNYDTLVERCVCAVLGLKVEVSMVGYTLKESVSAKLYPISLTPSWQRAPSRRTSASDPKSLPTLFKLHGSINWFYSGSLMGRDETIYFVPATSWNDEDPIETRRNTEPGSDKVPFIVPPLLEKNPFFQLPAIRSLWGQAGHELQRATRVFCLGYSLPETDITMRFFLQKNAPKARVKFHLITKPSPNDVDLKGRFQRLLGGQYEIDDSFVREESPIPTFVKKLIAAR